MFPIFLLRKWKDLYKIKNKFEQERVEPVYFRDAVIKIKFKNIIRINSIN